MSLPKGANSVFSNISFASPSCTWSAIGLWKFDCFICLWRCGGETKKEEGQGTKQDQVKKSKCDEGVLFSFATELKKGDGTMLKSTVQMPTSNEFVFEKQDIAICEVDQACASYPVSSLSVLKVCLDLQHVVLLSPFTEWLTRLSPNLSHAENDRAHNSESA
jgi:hypothetical protein